MINLTHTHLNSDGDDSNPDFKKLRQDLVAENAFLTTLINTIPAKMYFGHDVQEKITSEKHTLMNEKANALKKGFNHVELSSKSKHKRARIDPLCQKSVTQIQEEMDKKKKRKKRIKKLHQSSASLTRAANIEELQKRLQDRIKEFQSKRKLVHRTNPEESKKLLTRLKKMKVKAGRIEKEKKVLNPHKDSKKTKANDKPVYNKDNTIIYSKLDFSEDGNLETRKGEFTGKNYKKLLHKAEKKKEKIESMKSTNPELANSLEEKEKWKKAILKSENVKIKDDPSLLKKSIKRQEKVKKKKSKEWKERTEHVEHKMKARQDKRTKNLQKKKKEKLDKKIKHAKKKGRMVPGF